MSKLFISFILFCTFQTNFAFTNVRDDATWFRAGGDSIRKKFVTGVVNGIIDTNCEHETSGGYVQGECLSTAECLKENGRKGNICSVLGVCCVIERTCEETTSSKISYFVNPRTFHNDCLLNIKIYSKDVCQIRLDFEDFEIHQPTQSSNLNTNENEENEENEMAYKCHIDKFRVEKIIKNLGFTSLCGKNTGQHIYVPVQEGQREINLHFLLKNRSSDMLLQNPKWRIKIHQLECYDKKNQHGSGQTLDAHTKLVSLYQNLKQKKKTYKSDYDLVAPPNCLQYYPDRTGMFESFNYNNGRGPYIGGLDYSICFSKNSDYCFAEYSSINKFQLNYNTDINLKDRCHPNKEAGKCVSQDYIRISEGKLRNGQNQDYFCNQDFPNKGNVVTSRANEPLFIKVHTDDFKAFESEDCNSFSDKILKNSEDHAEIGFKFNYELGDCKELN